MATPKKAKVKRAPSPRINVSLENISYGIIKNSSHCPIALAVLDQFPDARSIAVDVQTIRWSDPGKGLRYTYLTPRIASVAILQIDQGVRPDPFSFRLRGSLVTTMYRGRGTQKPVHNLGRKRMVPNEKAKGKGGSIPDVIGGKPPPRWGMRREFGLRALSQNEVFKKKDAA